MIYVNGLKYAWYASFSLAFHSLPIADHSEACMKGHRSSSCSHTDRPLFEIKRKGRPVTQCEHCRQLRKTKQVHVKCNCEGSTEGGGKELRGKGMYTSVSATTDDLTFSAKRKMPMSPDFPEGLSGQSLSPSPAPQRKSKGE